MSDEHKVDGYYQRVAQQAVDMLFDKRYFDHETKRADMRNVEDYLAFLMESHANIAARSAKLLREIREKKEDPQTQGA